MFMMYIRDTVSSHTAVIVTTTVALQSTIFQSPYLHHVHIIISYFKLVLLLF